MTTAVTVGRYVHETDAVLSPGDLIVASATRGQVSRWADVPGYDPGRVYVTDAHDDAYDPGCVGHHGAHRYLVEPLGPVGADPEVEHWNRFYGDPANRQAFIEAFGAEQDEVWHPSFLGQALAARSTTAARVIRLIPESEYFTAA